MRILVTGAFGFVGRHVLHELEQAGHSVIAMTDQLPDDAPKKAYETDVRNADALKRIIAEVTPDACIHLGGIAFVPLGWKDPKLMYEVNAVGTMNLLEAFRHGHTGGRILLVSSSEIYGRQPRSERVKESDRLNPGNIYAVSKMAADLTGLLYARRYGTHVMTARPQNHIGPGQSLSFVVPSFAAQLADIAEGKAEPVMRVGNLDSQRDFLDVRDVARAYRLLLEKGNPGEAYNIASETMTSIRSILEELCAIAGVEPVLETDPERMRPSDDPLVLDSSRIREVTGWKPRIPIKDSLHDIYEHARTHPRAVE